MRALQNLGGQETGLRSPSEICKEEAARTAAYCSQLHATKREKVIDLALDEPSTPHLSQTLGNPLRVSTHINAGVNRLDEDGINSSPRRLTSSRPCNLEAACFRSLIIENCENPFAPFSWWLSQTNARQATEKLENASDAARIEKGYGVGFGVTLPWGIIWRSELLIYFWRKGFEPSLSFSFDLQVSFPKVVSWDTRSVCSAMCGDVDAMKAALNNKEATPFDVLPDGSTFLHVSLNEAPHILPI